MTAEFTKRGTTRKLFLDNELTRISQSMHKMLDSKLMMNQPQFLYFFLLVWLIASQNVSASPLARDGTYRIQKRKQVSPTGARDESQLTRDRALDHLRILASRFQSYRDAAIASKSLAPLASVVCRYDKSFALVFYFQALDLVKVRLRSEEAPRKRNGVGWLGSASSR